MRTVAKNITDFIVEMIQCGCCGAEIPPGIDWQGKTPQQALEDACQTVLGRSAEQACYSAKVEEGNYLSIAND